MNHELSVKNFTTMAYSSSSSFHVILLILFSLLASQCSAQDNPTLAVDVKSRGRPISKKFFGVFFEEINHAGAGGLWAELVNNRGFESGGTSMPSGISPWSILGNESMIQVTTELSSCFPRNKVAVKLHVLCSSSHHCPNGVGLSNPGFWGMNIEQGKKYKIVFYVRSLGSINIKVAFKGSNGKELASGRISKVVSKWTKIETTLEAKASDFNSSLELTTTKSGEIWLDQISAMPLDTQKGHGFRKDLYQMIADLKPRFIRFPGGTFVEGDFLRNAFRWKDSIGDWATRPGHFNDIWGYWVDDGFGFLEFLILAEDLGIEPIWVFNNGLSHHDEVSTLQIAAFVQEALDGIEFARGPVTSKWGKLRASLGHPEPFKLKMVAIGNEDCGKSNYQGNYVAFYKAIKHHYPDMQTISNCEAIKAPLNHTADYYDYHLYSSTQDFFNRYHWFDNAIRGGAKAYVSEYAVWGDDAGSGKFLPVLGEAAFLMGLEKNSDVVEMVSYAPLFVNTNDRKWLPDAIVFDSHRSYGTPSYWLQTMFSESSGATYLDSTLSNAPSQVVASTIVWVNQNNKKTYLKIKVVNFSNNTIPLNIKINGLESKVNLNGSTMTILTSSDVRSENSFDEPKKIVPQKSPIQNPSKDMVVKLPPNSVTSFDFPHKSI